MPVKVPLTIRDHLERAALVYGERIAAVDEPDQPAPSLGRITYGRLYELAAAQAARLDQMGIGRGERVAIVSQNAARLLVGFYGVSAWGRVYVPINFRLSTDEIAYIVGHCGATVLLLDPELEETLAPIECAHKIVLGRDDTELYLEGVEPEPWEPDEDATATINYTSGTTARPKGVQMTHRNLWVNAATFGWHAGVSDRDVYLHTLPMFHCNGWGMPYAVTGHGRAPRRAAQGRRGRDPPSGGGRGRHLAVRRAGRGGHDPRRRRHLGRTRPRGGPDPHGGGRGTAAHPHHRAGGERAGLGVHPDLRADRDRPAPHHQPLPRGVGRPARPPSGPRGWGGPGCRPSGSRW